MTNDNKNNGCTDGDDFHIPSSAGRHSKHSSPMLACFLLAASLIILGFDRHSKSSFSYPPTKQAGVENDATETIPLPPLADLVAPNGTIVGDISWMLDFAVVAFPKSGTTFMKNFLNQTNETYVYEREFCLKHFSDVADFVEAYHALHVKLKQPRHPKTVQFGLKCPGVFYRANDIHIYERYFPNTKLIIGLRHPVSWFESFYNYQSYRNVSLPPTPQLIGRCARHENGHQKVCTDRARFHAALARLGKTPMKDDREVALLFEEQRPNNTNHHRLRTQMGLPNRVLLYEIRQIHDEELSIELSANIRDYLGIREDFPPILSYRQTKPRNINICDNEHENVRRVLVGHGAAARTWIGEYLLKDPTVGVSSPISFRRMLDEWGVDPCLNNTKSQTA